PLRPNVLWLVAGLLAAVTVFELAVTLPNPPGTHPDALQTLAILALVLAWSGCVAEPTLRFWIASIGRPVVQKARLRALSLGYAGLVAVLLFAGFGGAAASSVPSRIAIQLVALVTVPLLWFGFSPPAWLRRLWREPEEEALREAIQDLLLFSPDRETLARRALEWALRLTGGDSGLIVGADGDVLATAGLSGKEAGRLAQELPLRAEELVAFGPPGGPAAIVHGLQLTDGSGSLIVSSGRFTPIFGSDEVGRLRLYAAAVTAGLDRVVLTERIAALEKTKSEFLNLASHELRGPITVLRGYLSMAAAGALGPVPDKLQAVLPVLAAKTEEMKSLVEQMIDAARLEEGKIELKPVHADLRDLVREAVANMRPLADERHQLVVEGSEQPVPVEVDRDRIGTVITNLISNAIKYSPHGGEVVCRVGRERRLGKVEVIDKGVGIPAADMTRLFTRFGRIDQPETRSIQGTGLGLYLSRELARLHGGDVTARSQPGHGSTFTLLVPVREGEA
ncbi:MAG TPA: HAMP domain-containing sensor histidine kinase, partial [Candidatus Acidoferrales bacterium]|nr:HAMP domain-containing sensor histidine kinase [Candidatus Acidoferrales bacterium]